MKNEKELQDFIAKNPWLLNINYESIPEIENQGVEYVVSNQQRIDLILRDKINKYPIIVEFKYTPFYRENIGQIIEYRARIVNFFRENNSELNTIFGEYLLCPKLILVVKESDDFFRVACNLSGIDLYEYKNMSHIFSDPEYVLKVQNFSDAFKTSKIPIKMDRGHDLEKAIYTPIRRILEKNNVLWAWMEPRGSSGYFYPQYNDLLINRWLFKGEVVSIGIYEKLFQECKVCISFYSNSKEHFELFLNKYNELLNENIPNSWSEEWTEGNIERLFDNKYFFENVEDIISKEILIYMQITDSFNKIKM